MLHANHLLTMCMPDFVYHLIFFRSQPGTKVPVLTLGFISKQNDNFDRSILAHFPLQICRVLYPKLVLGSCCNIRRLFSCFLCRWWTERWVQCDMLIHRNHIMETVHLPWKTKMSLYGPYVLCSLMSSPIIFKKDLITASLEFASFPL